MSTNIPNSIQTSVNVGGGGGGGSISTSGAIAGSGSWFSSAGANSTSFHVASPAAQGAIYTGSGLTFTDGTVTLSLDEIASRLDKIEKRLAILQPNEDLQDKFPALKQAYEEYKLIERLVDDGN